MADEKKKENEEKEEPKVVVVEDTGSSKKKGGKQKNGLAWVIGFMALTNLVFVYNNPEQKVRVVGVMQIALSILVWAASFVPGIRYVALIIMLPVWFGNLMVSGVPMMDRFSKGEPLFLGSASGPDYNLKDVIPNMKDQNPKV